MEIFTQQGKNTTKITNHISDLNQRISNLEQSKSDIDLLGNDTHNTYKFTSVSGDGAHMVTKGEDGLIYIETSGDALSIHEITHVRQAMKAGGLEFTSNGQLKNPGTREKSQIEKYQSISNAEVEAYQKQFSFQPESMPNRVSSIFMIDVHYVGSITYLNGKYGYPEIRAYSKYIKHLQKHNLNIPF